ncbi:MAG: hypothetical protein ACJ780_05400, partial [Solirubrobacteraceae bacterium]
PTPSTADAPFFAEIALTINGEGHSLTIDTRTSLLDLLREDLEGIGEIGIVGTAAAVGNAVYHATGVRLRELPIVPARLVARLDR